MKILEISIILPYYEATYTLGNPINMSRGGNAKNIFEKEIVKKIYERSDVFLIETDKGKTIYISKELHGLIVCCGEEKEKRQNNE